MQNSKLHDHIALKINTILSSVNNRCIKPKNPPKGPSEYQAKIRSQETTCLQIFFLISKIQMISDTYWLLVGSTICLKTLLTSMYITNATRSSELMTHIGVSKTQIWNVWHSHYGLHDFLKSPYPLQSHSRSQTDQNHN